MGSIWLTDLPDVLAGAGLDVDVWPGWETRARSSGGYDAVRAVFCHHTASQTSPHNDMSYMWDNTSGDQPIGAIYLDRAGRLTVGAAGATNTQGKGGPWSLSTGTIPKDSGNAYGIAIEAASNGTGEAWPAEQTDAYVAACRALCNAYGLEPTWDVLSHREWCQPSCPGRKVDPVGPSPYATGAESWDMSLFRRDVAAGATPVPVPTPIEGDPDMIALDLGRPGVDEWWTRMTYTGSEICHVRSPADQVQARGGVPVVSVTEVELSALLDTLTAIGPSPFGVGQAPNAALDVKWTQARGRT